MKRIFFSTIIFFMAVVQASGQYYTNENMNWAFGLGAGVSFNTGAPVAFTSGIAAHEGCASVSDSAGNLLFYTNGDVVYDKTGAAMPSGAAIVSYSTISTTQGAVIMPVIGTSNQYYIFSLAEGGSRGFLSYSIIDMSLRGGLGDVTATKGIQIGDSLSEKMVAIAGNKCDIWLIVHRLGKVEFIAYNVSAMGIDTATPVISYTGTFTDKVCYNSGVIKGSPDRKKIVAACEDGVELYDFDPNTGIISNCRVLGTRYTYGAEFSPNNTKLYTGQQSPEDSIYQFDITLATTTAIIASKTAIAVSNVATDLRLAPDGKIYMSCLFAFGLPFLDCISQPDLPGLSCNYIARYVHLTNSDYIGLPNLYVCFPPVSAGVITGDTILCQGYPITLSDAAVDGVWSSADSFVVVSGGCYIPGLSFGLDTIFYIASNGCVSDTAMHIVRVTDCAPPISLLAGANGLAGKDALIYPNPTYGELNISSTHNITSVTVTDLPGRELYNQAFNTENAQLNVANLSAGVYFIKINGAEVQKIVKQ